MKQEVEAWRSLFREKSQQQILQRQVLSPPLFTTISEDLEKNSDDIRVFEFSPNQLLVCLVVSSIVLSATALLFPGSPLQTNGRENNINSRNFTLISPSFAFTTIRYALDLETEAYTKLNRFTCQVLMSTST